MHAVFMCAYLVVIVVIHEANVCDGGSCDCYCDCAPVIEIDTEGCCIPTIPTTTTPTTTTTTPTSTSTTTTSTPTTTTTTPTTTTTTPTTTTTTPTTTTTTPTSTPTTITSTPTTTTSTPTTTTSTPTTTTTIPTTTTTTPTTTTTTPTTTTTTPTTTTTTPTTTTTTPTTTTTTPTTTTTTPTTTSTATTSTTTTKPTTITTIPTATPTCEGPPGGSTGTRRYFMGKCYELILCHWGCTAAEMRTDCGAAGSGMLVTVTSALENYYINEVLAGAVLLIGANDRDKEGTWVWEDGSPLVYTNWAEGHPMSVGRNLDCALIVNQEWKNVDCDGPFEYAVCERAHPG